MLPLIQLSIRRSLGGSSIQTESEKLTIVAPALAVESEHSPLVKVFGTCHYLKEMSLLNVSSVSEVAPQYVAQKQTLNSQLILLEHENATQAFEIIDMPENSIQASELARMHNQITDLMKEKENLVQSSKLRIDELTTSLEESKERELKATSENLRIY
ncbi:hypothetical protein ACFE04_022282 [Oxalis oulophora]